MLLGYNHNISYKGEVYHVQTEDSGLRNPHIITLLYRAGVILCSRKTSYADIIKIDNLEAVVEDLMKEQHKEMMRRLKNGEFDDKIATLVVSSAVAQPVQAPDAADTDGREGSAAPVASQSEAPPVSAPAAPRQVPSLDDAVARFFDERKG